MALRVGIGVSSLEDAANAARRAAEAARGQCEHPKLVLVLVSHAHPLSAIALVQDAAAHAFPGATIAGAMVNGVVYEGVRHDAYYGAHSVAVVALDGEELNFGIAQLPHPGEDPLTGGRQLGLAARRHLGRPGRGGILFTPGLSAEPSIDPLLLDGLREVVPGLRLSGAGTCGGLDLKGVPLSGATFLGERIEPRGSLLILFGGDMRQGFSGANGLRARDSGAQVSESQGPLVRALDGRPARDVVLELLAGKDALLRERMAQAPTVMCMENSICLAEERDGFLWIHMPAAFLPDGAMIDPFHPRNGSRLRVVDLDRESCMSAVDEAADLLAEDAGARELDFVLSFSCALRGFTLGGESSNEDARLLERLGARKQLGVIANGEIACHRAQGPFATGWLYSLFGMGAV